jgi:DNA-binding NarL/FixJ family response regulator
MNTLRILLVDDHNGFRQTLIAFLHTQEGVEVVGEASNGKEAVEKAEELQPDLVLMDLDMPKRNGFEATKQIKQHSPSTKVIILSMHSGDVYRLMARQYRADGFIDKSTLKSGLFTVLASFLTGNEYGAFATTKVFA